MSLEQALIDNTAALIAQKSLLEQLLARLMNPVVVAESKTVTDTAAIGGVSTTKTTKTTKVVKPATKPVNEGDAEGTRYFKNETHDTVYRISPTDAQQEPLPGGVEISGADFLAHKPKVASGEGSAASTTTVDAGAADDLFGAAVEPMTAQKMTDKLRELFKAKGGNPALLPILQKVGAASIPAIAEDKRQQAYDLAVAALAA